MNTAEDASIDRAETAAPPVAGPDSAEFKVLLEACATRPNDGQLRAACCLLNDEQWNRLLALADHHCVTALLYVALAKIGEPAVPKVLSAELGRRYTLNVHRSLLQARELLRVLGALGAAGVEAIPYKGLVLSELAYGDMAMRQAGDLDVLIRARDLVAAQAVAEKLGYTPSLRLSEEERRRYLKVGYEMTFDYGSQRNLLELKWGILPRFYAVDFDMDALCAAARSKSFSGTDIRQMALEDLVLVLCVHAAKHCWSRLIWLCDLSRLFRKPLDWAALTERARALGVLRILRVGVDLANRLLQARISVPLELGRARDPAAGALADETANQIFTDRAPAPESLAYFRQMLRFRERAGDRARFVSRLAFTPGPGEWNAIHLSGPLALLYRLVRIGRLGARLVRGRSAQV